MFGAVLVAFAFLTDAAAVAATHSWPVSVSSTAVYALLAVAWVLSIAAYFTLRSSGGRDEGPTPGAPDPDPPWWPEFERDFRDYAGRGPQPGSRPRPRQPVA